MLLAQKLPGPPSQGFRVPCDSRHKGNTSLYNALVALSLCTNANSRCTYLDAHVGTSTGPNVGTVAWHENATPTTLQQCFRSGQHFGSVRLRFNFAKCPFWKPLKGYSFASNHVAPECVPSSQLSVCCRYSRYVQSPVDVLFITFSKARCNYTNEDPKKYWYCLMKEGKQEGSQMFAPRPTLPSNGGPPLS